MSIFQKELIQVIINEVGDKYREGAKEGIGQGIHTGYFKWCQSICRMLAMTPVRA